MISEKPQVTVEATVAGHDTWKGKPTIKLDIPAWSERYPTVLYGIGDEERAQLPIGQTLRIVLSQDNLKEGKDGSKPWDFFYSFVRIANAGSDPSPAAAAPTRPATPGASPAAAAPAAAVAPAATDTSKDQAIRRAVALKAAVELTAHKDISKKTVLEIADSFVEWLEASSTLAVPPVSPASSTPSAAPPAPTDEEEPPDPDFDSLPSVTEGARTSARLILTKLDSKGDDYKVTKDLFDSMMTELALGTASINKALGGLAPLAWLKEEKTRTYRDAARVICGVVKAGA